MAPIRRILGTAIAEEATAFLTTVARDTDGVGIPAASLDALTVTLYDEESGDIINTRDQQSILNEQGGTVDGVGNVSLRLDPADTPILDDTLTHEWHIALFEWNWQVGSPPVSYYGKAEVKHKVRNLEKVPGSGSP